MINKKTKLPLMITALTAMATLSGCAGVQVSQFNYDDSFEVNKPVKAEDCYDASVLLGAEASAAKDIAKKVLVAVDSTIKEETDAVIKAQRNRHIGLVVGSGGEELAVTLKDTGGKNTFMTVTTKTGFVGAAGQKPWSCKIVDELVNMASK